MMPAAVNLSVFVLPVTGPAHPDGQKRPTRSYRHGAEVDIIAARRQIRTPDRTLPEGRPRRAAGENRMASTAGTAAATRSVEFESLAEHRPYLMKIARLELRDEHLAEDCVADALAQAYEHRARFRGDSSLRTWLTSILKNRMIDLLRKQWREQPIEETASGEQDFDSLFDAGGHYAQMPSEVRDPAELCQQDGFLAAVQRCVDRLPRRIGQVFVLREVLGSDTAELCKDLGMTASNVWVQLYRARMMLRTCLEKTGFGNAHTG
jgi:RNA polymerase sigma-70 factor (ECF subfamily)